MTPLVVLLAAAAAAYGILRVRRSGRGRAAVAALRYGILRARRIDWSRAMLAELPRRGAPGTASPTGGQHRIEDAHTGSLSATEILRALNDGLGWVGRIPCPIHAGQGSVDVALAEDPGTRATCLTAGPGVEVIDAPGGHHLETH